MTARFADSALHCAALAARLGWSPECFWRATPADLAHALGAVDAAKAPLSRGELESLMETDRDG